MGIWLNFGFKKVTCCLYHSGTVEHSTVNGFRSGFGMAYQINMDLISIKIHMDYRFLWNGYGFRILEKTDFGMDIDLVSNPFGPTDYNPFKPTD